MGEPLSIHYGGGSTLSSDIAEWRAKKRIIKSIKNVFMLKYNIKNAIKKK